MSHWKAVAALLVLLAGLWYLYPSTRSREGDGAQVVEITFMREGGPVADATADVVDAFERESRIAHQSNPTHPIYQVITGQNAARDQVGDPTRFLVSVAGSVPPDVIWFDRFAIAEFAARGAFEPLDRFIASDRQSGLTDFPRKERYFAPCWEEAVYDGQVYGVPINADNRALVYNRDLFERAGLIYQDGPLKGHARPPRTWAELEEYALKLTEWADADRTRLKVVGLAPGVNQGWLYTYGWMNGGEFLSDDGRTCTLNDPRIVEALAYMKRICEKNGGYKNIKSFETGFGKSNLDPFVQGRVAMKIEGVGILNDLALHGPDLNFAIAPLPLSEAEWNRIGPQRRREGLTVSWLGGWALAIPKGAKNQDAAWALIRFMTSDRGMRIRAESARQLAEAAGRHFLPEQNPVKHLNEEFFQQYVLGNPNLPTRFVDGMRVYNALLPYSRYRPVTSVGQRLWNAQKDGMQNSLYGDDPKTVLDYETAVVQRELDTFFAPKRGIQITSWGWFFVLYGLLIVAAGAVVFFWDTRRGLRQWIAARIPRLNNLDRGVIQGAGGGYFRKQWKEGLICVSPWLVGFLVFGGGPMLFSALMSLCEYDVIHTPRFVGLSNYRTMFSEDHLFTKSLWNTAFMLLGVPLGMVLSLAIALLLNLKIRGIAVWRTFFYLPSIVPMVAASVLFVWVFNPQSGLINRVLELVGIEGPHWLLDVRWSKPSIIILGLWGAGAGMIIWLAGLKGISDSLYEAAEVDGAGAWRKLLNVTLPQLTPYIFFNLIMGLIGTFQIFGQAFIMTEGGPNNSTLFFVYYLFNNAFRYGKMGYASAMAWVLLLIVLVLTAFQLKYAKRWVHYEGE